MPAAAAAVQAPTPKQPVEPSAPPEYTMPAVALGDIVWWFTDGDPLRVPVAHIVWEVHPRTIELASLNPVTWGRRINHVRHMTDPLLGKNAEWRQYGAWDYTAKDKMIAKLCRDLA